MSTKIQWTDRVWNVTRGCSPVSEGCRFCYAQRQAHRFSGSGMPYEGLTELGPHGPRWNGKIRLVPEALEQPLHWRKPRRIFVNSMSDLFHEDVPDEFIYRVFDVMRQTCQHTFQVLTKRAERMKHVCESLRVNRGPDHLRWPLRNVWLGVSCEDQTTADKRIPILSQIPAAVRFVSFEPLLGPVTLVSPTGTRWPYLGWAILGGESGLSARPCDLDWIRSLKEECRAWKVPVFVKQVGSRWFDTRARQGTRGSVCVPIDGGAFQFVTQKDKKGGDPSEWPEDLRAREFPR